MENFGNRFLIVLFCLMLAVVFVLIKKGLLWERVKYLLCFSNFDLTLPVL